jgi:hypothetical protein
MLGRKKRSPAKCPVCGENSAHRGKVKVLVRDPVTGRRYSVWRICGTCSGNGMVACPVRWLRRRWRWVPCNACQQKGYIPQVSPNGATWNRNCRECKGKKQVRVPARSDPA